jgi:hypothetical protein
LPTLPLEQAIEAVQELMQTNGGCELPCWWGIMPGTTTWVEAKAFLEPMAFYMDEWFDRSGGTIKFKSAVYFARDESPTLINSRRVRFSSDDESKMIDIIATGTSQPIREFFEKYGLPDQIFIEASERVGVGPGFYFIYMFYPSLGIVANISGESEFVRRGEEDFTILCQDYLYEYGQGVGLILFSPENPKTFEDLTYDPAEYHPPEPLEEATNMTIGEFYELLMGQSPDKCLEIPMGPWGY